MSAAETVTSTWSLVTTAWPWWVGAVVACVALAAVWWLQAPRPVLLVSRSLATVLLALLLTDPALSRTIVRLEPAPVAVVVDVSGSLAHADRHLPADRLLDLAEAFAVIAPEVRSAGPRQMSAALTALRADLSAALSRNVPPARLRAHATALRAAATAGAGYLEAERTCREAAALAERLVIFAATPPTFTEDPEAPALREQIAVCAAAIALVVPRLATEQAAGDAALIAGWRSADDPAARARVLALDALLSQPRGQLAARLAEQVVLPALGRNAALTTWALDERLRQVTPDLWKPGAGGTDFAALGDLARGWAAGRTPGAVVLISDGRNQGGDPRPALRALAARGARLLTIGVGDEASPDEPALLTLDAPAVVRVGGTITLNASVRRGRSAAANPGWDVVVTLDAIEMQRLAVPEDGPAIAVMRLGVPAGKAGLRRCAGRLERRKGPAISSGIQVDSAAWLPCPVRVTDAPLRVLVAEALPRWETRALVAALESDPLCVVERRYLQGPGAVMAALPADSLLAADAVILGDLIPAELPPEDQARLATFVGDGGFLAVVAGPRGMPAAYPLGPLADLLPVRANRGTPASGPATLALTPAGLQHPLGRLVGDADLDRRLWAALPPPTWVAGGISATSDAEVLVEATCGSPTVLPAIAVRAAGVGRVLWMGTPETWRWRTFERGRVQTAFWLQALRWGIAGRPRGVDPDLRVVVDPPRIDARGTAELLIASANVPRAMIIDADGVSAPVSLQASGAHRWRGLFADLAGGMYRITVDAGSLHEERDLLVRPQAASELADPTADFAALRALAGDCGGTATTAADLGPVIRDLARGLRPEAVTTTTTWRLGDGLWLGLLLGALLALEWALRKRSGMP